MKKKAGKKKKAEATDIVTNSAIQEKRRQCMYPRLGDVFVCEQKVDELKTDIMLSRLNQAVENQAECVNLSGGNFLFLYDQINDRSMLSFITDLNLSRNCLFESDQIFAILQSLPQLLMLNLSRNFFNGALSTTAGNLVFLESLILDDNQFNALPSSVESWSMLKKFSAVANNFVSLPPECGSWSSLEVLNLRNNRIQSLPHEIGRLKKLDSLLVSRNVLVELPESIGENIEMKIFEVHNNALKSLPVGLKYCTSLRILDLGHNYIGKIEPELFESLGNLRKIYLHSNKLSSLPSDIGLLKNLEYMSISGNPLLQELPLEIGNCEALQELYMNNCPKLKSIPASIYKLKMLRELSASKCRALRTIPNSITDCESLRNLDVKMEKKQFCKLNSDLVEVLQARRCKIRGGVIKKVKPKKSKK